MKKDIHKMNQGFFKSGGVFDKFAGKDHRMQFAEMQKLHQTMKAGFAAKLGEKLPEDPKGSMKAGYDAYNKLSSKVDGVSKSDFRVGQRIMNKIRDNRISPREID